MATCANCGQASGEGFRFCPHCGAPLAVGEGRPRTERKVVTVLFCDLVGFTSRSDRADPEDVRAILEPFHALAKREIERHGGTLDKFIGDAAMGVFGSPVAHEDDPERAVRAGLRILGGMAELNSGRDGGEPMQVRVGVNTGEAVVTLASGVQLGENVAGDVVNIASRLQSAAAPGGIIVGEPTFLATRDAVRYEQLEPVTAKGKAEPLRVWRAVDIRALPTISDREGTTPFVGREAEVAKLQRAFLRTVEGPEVHLVTIVGEPGVGKSRLVAELRSSLVPAGSAPTVQWRRGRCLPYGDGITFWALGEIVKALAGVLDSDPTGERNRKLAATVERTAAHESERAWFRARLASLVGGDAGPPVEREEAFAAWARFLRLCARQEPMVAVFEDIHWADPAMLAFLEFLAEDGSEPAPLLALATTRPELFDRRPGGLRGADLVSLQPLGDEETSQLLGMLLEASSFHPETKAWLLERSGGNPLYAEELARVLRERALLDRDGRLSADTSGLAFPDSLQALIAARIDTLEPEPKTVLHDASVIGRVFWSGAVAFLGESPENAVRQDLDRLGVKDMVRPAHDSSLANQTEYAFRHALIRDVAYGQLTRSARAARHRRAAAWIESTSGERVADLAEIVAYHAMSALELSRAAGQDEKLEELEHLAVRYLRLAAQRAMALDVSKAEAQFEQALLLVPEGDPERFAILASLAETAFQAGRFDESDERYRQAIDGLMASGATLQAADAMARRSVVLEYRGDTVAGRALLSDAIALLSDLPPGPELARALATSAGSLLGAGRFEELTAEAARSIELAEQVGEPAAAARAHGYRGYARALGGDPEGVLEQRESLAALRSLGLGRPTAIACNNLGSCLNHVEGSREALEVFREGVAFAQARGLSEMVMALQNSMLTALFELGQWDDVLRLGDDVVDQARRSGSGYDEVFAEADQAVVRALREGASARPFCESVLERARPIEDAPLVLLATLGAAIARLDAGDVAGAVAAVREAIDITEDEPIVRAGDVALLARLTVGAGDVRLAERALAGTEDLVLQRYRLARTTARAVIDEARGEYALALADFEDAVGRWDALGHAVERAEALFGAGRCLLALGRVAEARARFDPAAQAFDSLGAMPSLERIRAIAR